MNTTRITPAAGASAGVAGATILAVSAMSVQSGSVDGAAVVDMSPGDGVVLRNSGATDLELGGSAVNLTSNNGFLLPVEGPEPHVCYCGSTTFRPDTRWLREDRHG